MLLSIWSNAQVIMIAESNAAPDLTLRIDSLIGTYLADNYL